MLKNLKRTDQNKSHIAYHSDLKAANPSDPYSRVSLSPPPPMEPHHHHPCRRRRRRPPITPLLLFLFFVFATVAAADDAAVMQKLAAALRPAGWSSTSGDPCADKWPNVNCNAGRVVAVNLASKANPSAGASLPADLNKLSELQTLALQSNGIAGALPSLAGMANLQHVFLDGNNFTSMPPDFFSGLTSLRIVSLNGNSLAPWTIPNDLAQCTSLGSFYASSAGVTGTIPAFFGELPNLSALRLSYNNLSGSLPSSFAGSSIQNLWLNNQQPPSKLAGGLAVLASMASLSQVWLHGNAFTGPVPDLANCTDLFDLQIRDNQLTGVLPPSLFSMPKLVNVSLGHNMLQGPFPSFKAGVLVDDNLDRNNFCDTRPGPCDEQVSILLSIEQGFGFPAKLADSWTGNDACNGWSFVSCDTQRRNVTVLGLSNQGLSGTISPDIAKLASLKTLLLNNNNLTGAIPEVLTSMPLLQSVDVSNNNLSGKVPAFAESVGFNASGNPLLGIVLPPGETGGSNSSSGAPGGAGTEGKRSSSFMSVRVIVPIVVVVAAAIACIVAFLLIKKAKKGTSMGHFPLVTIDPGKGKAVSPIGSGGRLIAETNSRGSSGRNDMPALDAGSMALSIRVLREVTNDFSSDHIVGKGGFGVVYRGRLQDGTDIAVKRMMSVVVDDKGMDEFKAEIAVLTKVRHRHLVALLGYCAEDDERLLVYEYMPQGTLGQHLFEYKEYNWEPLTWKQRLIIALDVARGVEYLHTLALKCFIHRDLKPSNILLGDDMRAKVSDFGLVRPAPHGKNSVFTRVAGTFGYLAPEYVGKYGYLGRLSFLVPAYRKNYIADNRFYISLLNRWILLLW